MRTRFILTVLIASVVSATVAKADDKKGGLFFIEPKAGYAFLGNLSAGDSFSGINVGARAGITIARMFMIGGLFDYMPSVTYSTAGGSAMSPSPTYMQIGAMGGFSFPSFPLRIWGGYNFIANMGNVAFNGQTVGFSGSSIVAGIGYKILPFVSIDVEGYLPTLNDISVGGISVPLTSFGGTGLSGKYILASISFPISF